MLDRRDHKILEYLQRNADMPVSELADRVGVSPSACWRRIKHLQQNGWIKQKVVLLDRRKINLGMTVFIAVRTSRHSIEWLERFRCAIDDIPEIVEAYRLAGDIDYLLRLALPDVDAYDTVYKKLISRLEFTDISSFIGMEELKYTTVLPLDYAR